MGIARVSSDTMARIRAAIEHRIAPMELLVEDESARHIGHPGAREGGHFRVRVVSERFRGLTRVARHRMVYEAVAELMGRGVHALAVDARTPDEINQE
jgi:BolA family transcriptional regulator, general stress-responsive regulator